MDDSALFIASRGQIDELVPLLRLQRREEWYSLYLDPRDGTTWRRFPLWYTHGPGPECLRRDPLRLHAILGRISSSTQDSEVAAAAFYLVNEFVGCRENLGPLVETLTAMMAGGASVRDARNVALAIAWSHADVPFNHRNPIGKTPADVEADYGYFVGLARIATALRAEAEVIAGRVRQDESVLD
jgi:hypothetical protein